MAARFVSGYAWDAVDVNQRELHAWAEVYLPGASWRGYDPTMGLAVANRHIAIEASPTAEYCPPTAGTFTGPPVRTELRYEIQMDTEDITPIEPDDSDHTFVWSLT